MDKIHQDFSGGLLTQVHTSELDGKIHITHSQDLQPHVEYATALRNSEEYTRQGIKRGWMHAAHIPDMVVIELKQIGVDILGGRPSAKEIVAGIKKLGKEYLLTTRARV